MKIIRCFKQTLFLLSFLLIGFAQFANAQANLTLPPHKTTYSFGVRGYYFVAPTNFKITGLRVPSEAGSGTQNIQVIKINDSVSLYPSFGTNFTSLKYIKGAASGAIQNVNIVVETGDIIGVFGEAGTSVSYTESVSPFASSISGHPIMLNRLLFQGNIDIDSITNYATDATGALGRVEMYYNCLAPKADNIVADETSPCVFNFNLTNKKYADSYEWDFGDGTAHGSGSAAAHAYTNSGSHVVRAILKNDCDSTVLLKAVYCATTGIAKNQTEGERIKLYPNPASNLLTIESQSTSTLKEITIYNFLGQKVYQGSVENKMQQTINISQLPTGIYAVYIQTGKSSIIRKLEVLH